MIILASIIGIFLSRYEGRKWKCGCVAIQGLLLVILCPVLLIQGDVILEINKIGEKDLKQMCN